METKDIIERMKSDMKQGLIKVLSNKGFRYYTDTTTETLKIPITTTEETARLYEKLVINKKDEEKIDPFEKLPRVSLFVGQPDTGKTYFAEKIARDCGIVPLLKMCRDNLNLETLLEDFKLTDGNPTFEESIALKMLSDDERHIIIFDEYNTLLTGVMKTMQPIFDKTSTTFEYRGKIYKKNLNCKFILTLNDKDKGISIVPDAILSRAHIKWFDPVSVETIAQWTNTDVKWVEKVYNIYKILNLLGIFGTRQIEIIRYLDAQEIKNHLIGLCSMKNIDARTVTTLQVESLIASL
jgi:hypothetical protein